MAPTTRRELLGAALFAALAGVAGVAVATPDSSIALPPPLNHPPGVPYHPGPGLSLDRHKRYEQRRADMEADLLRFYRDASATEKAAILRLMERTLAGDDMHAVGVDLMMAFGVDEAEAHAQTAAALAGRRATEVHHG